MTLDERIAAAVREGKVVASLMAWHEYEVSQYEESNGVYFYVPFSVRPDWDRGDVTYELPGRNEHTVSMERAKKIVIAGKPPSAHPYNEDMKWTGIEELGEPHE